ncbi:hypothetical protein BJX96DRAFT_78821 [Aspergillus floccosus]
MTALLGYQRRAGPAKPLPALLRNAEVSRPFVRFALFVLFVSLGFPLLMTSFGASPRQPYPLFAVYHHPDLRGISDKKQASYPPSQCDPHYLFTCSHIPLVVLYATRIAWLSQTRRETHSRHSLNAVPRDRERPLPARPSLCNCDAFGMPGRLRSGVERNS